MLVNFAYVAHSAANALQLISTYNDCISQRAERRKVNSISFRVNWSFAIYQLSIPNCISQRAERRSVRGGVPHLVRGRPGQAEPVPAARHGRRRGHRLRHQRLHRLRALRRRRRR